MTVEEGLQAVARLCHLTVRREKDLLYVYTKAEADQGDDLPVRVYHLNYVRGSDLQKMIKPLLSKRGTITASPDSEVGIKSDANKAGGDSLGGGRRTHRAGLRARAPSGRSGGGGTRRAAGASA